MECIFWLYVTLMEELLPINYYNQMLEASIVTGEVFNFIF